MKLPQWRKKPVSAEPRGEKRRHRQRVDPAIAGSIREHGVWFPLSHQSERSGWRNE